MSSVSAGRVLRRGARAGAVGPNGRNDAATVVVDPSA